LCDRCLQTDLEVNRQFNGYCFHGITAGGLRFVPELYHPSLPAGKARRATLCPYVCAATEGANAESNRVLRGGSWNVNHLDCRCACRLRRDPGSRHGVIDFRVCCALPS
jgi:formylglycine-generating enzyme required for sulfatase activity